MRRPWLPPLDIFIANVTMPVIPSYLYFVRVIVPVASGRIGITFCPSIG